MLVGVFKGTDANGHPYLGMSLSNLADLYQTTGEYAEAEPLYREALNMCRALYARFGSPAVKPIGSSSSHLPILGSYMVSS